MIKAVLNTAIRPVDDDVHLRSACVQEHAGASGTIWVDARLFDQLGNQVFPKECRLPGYEIRFGKPDEPNPSGEGVLLVSITSRENGPSRFFTQTENADWQARRPNVFAPSHCGCVSGIITSSRNGFEVAIVPAPRSDLE